MDFYSNISSQLPIWHLSTGLPKKAFFHISCDISRSVRPMTMIFFWRKGLHLENLFNTQNIVFRCIENFLEAFEVKLLPQNSSVCQKFRRSNKAWFYFFHGLFHVSCDILRSICPMFMIFFWRKGLRLENILNTQNIVFRSVKGFLEAFEVNLLPKKSSVCQTVEISDKHSSFGGSNLTSKASKKISTHLKTMFWVF